MGESEAARKRKLDELDEPGARPLSGSYAENAGSTEQVSLEELVPAAGDRRWDGEGQVTEHLSLTDLDPLDAGDLDANEPISGWSAKPALTEAVELEEFEILERIDPTDANVPPSFPAVGLRRAAPHAPLSVRRPASVRPGAPAGARPKSVPPPTPKSAPPPTRAQSIAQAPRPMIGSEQWVPEGRISLVDFSAVLDAPSTIPPAGEAAEPFVPSLPNPPSLPSVSVAPPEEGRGSGGRMAAVLLLLVAVGAGAYFMGRRGTAPPPAGSNGPTVGTQPAGEPSPAPATPSAVVTEGLDRGDATDDLDEPRAADDIGDQAEETRAAVAERSATRSATSRGTRSGATRSGVFASPSPGPSPMGPVAAVPSMATPATTGRAAPPDPAPARASMAPAAELPDHPSRDDVQSALQGVQGPVRECLGGQHGTVRVRVTVRGSGRVTTALVQDSMWATPPTGSCIARAVRGARFPQFSEDSFVVLYPFQI